MNTTFNMSQKLDAVHGQDVLQLVLAQRYLEKLLANKMVAKYLRQHQPEVLEQFEKIVSTESLDQPGV